MFVCLFVMHVRSVWVASGDVCICALALCGGGALAVVAVAVVTFGSWRDPCRAGSVSRVMLESRRVVILADIWGWLERWRAALKRRKWV